MSATCDYDKVCTPGPSKDCERVKGRCLCDCHPDGLTSPKPDNWKPSPLHTRAINVLQDLADELCLEDCDDDECYFPRCLADGCEAEPCAPDAPGVVRP